MSIFLNEKNDDEKCTGKMKQANKRKIQKKNHNEQRHIRPMGIPSASDQTITITPSHPITWLPSDHRHHNAPHHKPRLQQRPEATLSLLPYPIRRIRQDGHAGVRCADSYFPRRGFGYEPSHLLLVGDSRTTVSRAKIYVESHR